MTLIVGMKCADAVVLGAETEEAAGYTAKRQVYKLERIEGMEWVVVVGGSGDSMIVENAVRRLRQQLAVHPALTTDGLREALDNVLAAVYQNYIDPDGQAEGISLMIGAVCGAELHLISTRKRAHQFHDTYAYSGIAADLAVYLLEHIYDESLDWKNAAKTAAFVLLQAIESSQYCGGESQLYVLQAPPNPRWRALGRDNSLEIYNVGGSIIWNAARLIRRELGKIQMGEEGEGYEEESNRKPSRKKP